MSTNANLVIYDPNKGTQLAQMQGQLAGIQAGNATYCGVATAPTSIYNQAGYIAYQDPSTGYIQLQKTQNDSLFTYQWYDQNLNTTFNFSGYTQGTQTNPTQTNQTPVNQQNGVTTFQNAYAYPNSNGVTTFQNAYAYPNGNGYTAVQTPFASNGQPVVYQAVPVNNEYSWGGTYIAVDPSLVSGNQTTNGQYQVDENGEVISITAKDLQEMVDAGIYDNMEEALAETQNQGYLVEEDELAKCGIYTEETEKQIEMLMDKYQISREEALDMLGDKAVTNSGKEENVENMFNELVESGFSKEEAAEYLSELGHEVPEELVQELPEYSEEDQAKIDKLVETTGCTPQEAAEIIGAEPLEPEKDGWLKRGLNAIGGFFSDCWDGICDGWNSFWDWVW